MLKIFVVAFSVLIGSTNAIAQLPSQKCEDAALNTAISIMTTNGDSGIQVTSKRLYLEIEQENGIRAGYEFIGRDRNGNAKTVGYQIDIVEDSACKIVGFKLNDAG
jgi:hypothetical protein